MGVEMASLTMWMFLTEVLIPQDVLGVFIEGEQPYAAFETCVTPLCSPLRG